MKDNQSKSINKSITTKLLKKLPILKYVIVTKLIQWADVYYVTMIDKLILTAYLSEVILCLEVRELYSWFIHIYIFCQQFYDFKYSYLILIITWFQVIISIW